LTDLDENIDRNSENRLINEVVEASDINEVSDTNNHNEVNEDNNDEVTKNYLLEGDKESKKIYIYASYDCGSIAGALTKELSFSKNSDEKEKWILEISDIESNIIKGHILSLSGNKYWGVVDSKLSLVDPEEKKVLSLEFISSDKSKNVCDIKFVDLNKFVQLSKDGELVLVENLSEDNFKFKVIQIDE
jgi:hypothetical protein